MLCLFGSKSRVEPWRREGAMTIHAIEFTAALLFGAVVVVCLI